MSSVPVPVEPEVNDFPVPSLTKEAIDRALALVPEGSNGAVVAFTTNGISIEGVVAARLSDRWSFVTMVSHDLTPKGETVGTAVVRFNW